MTDRLSIEVGLLNLLSEVMGTTPDELSESPVLAAHPWDSLTTLEALVQVETLWNVSLDLRAYLGARTVDDLVELIVGAKGVMV
jgi:acyl carrier protein